jgi:hypothetical protein
MSHMYVDSYRTISVPHSEQSLPKPITPETPIDCPSNTVSPVNAHLGNGILFPKANATHPPIKHSPPKGVTGPNALNLCGSSTSKYMPPLNIVMPATNKLAASVFFGATALERRRTPE